MGAVALVGLWCGGVGPVRVRAETPSDIAAKPGVGWDAAVAARVAFEAEPRRTHTREEYARVMNGFRAIYHSDPDNAHAAEAVAQVAELLNEMGREFGDRKSVHDAAGQYEYLAKAYPGDKLAAEALVNALKLLGPADADEAAKVKAQLVQDYPREARAAGVVVQVASNPTSQNRDVGHPVSFRNSTHDGEAVKNGALETVARNPTSQNRDVGHPSSFSDPTHDDGTVMKVAPGGLAGSHLSDDKAVAKMGHPGVVSDETLGRVIPEKVEVQTGPLAVVTGIRHWSTASYTRVAIDLNVAPGEEVKYEAARVENPDRIFFDLGHARLAPELAGKSFNVTDDGFLTRVRAAQFNDEVTRVVLDVHHVAEYSAFLLPNPYRLIIDIHGNAGQRVSESASQRGPGSRRRGTAGGCGARGDVEAWRGGGGFQFAADAGDGRER